MQMLFKYVKYLGVNAINWNLENTVLNVFNSFKHIEETQWSWLDFLLHFMFNN